MKKPEDDYIKPLEKYGIGKDDIKNWISKGLIEPMGSSFRASMLSFDRDAITINYLEIDSDGKVTPSDEEEPHVFRPYNIPLKLLQDSKSPLFIVIDVKNAMALGKAGYYVISIENAKDWKTAKEVLNNRGETSINREVLPEIKKTVLKGRWVYICVQKSEWQNINTKTEWLQFAGYLSFERGADVKLVELPQNYDKDVGQYLQEYGKEAFVELCKNAKIIGLAEIKNHLSKNVAPPQFPYNVLPENMRTPLQNLAKNMDASSEYLFTLSLGTISILMCGRFAVSLNQNWLEHPNLWLGLIGQPSQKKSPVLKIFKKILSKYEKVLIKKWTESEVEYKKNLNKYKAELEKYKQDVKKNLEVEPPVEPVRPLKPHLTVQDTTVEALVMTALANQAYGFDVGIFVDELAHFLKSLNMYKKNGNDVEHFLSAWSGTEQTIIRKSTNTDVTLEVAYSIIGSIQPKVLKKLFFSDGYDITNGFVERWLYVLTNYIETGNLPDTGNYDLTAFKDCCEQIFNFVINNPTVTKIYTLDESADKLFKQFFQKVTKAKQSPDKTDSQKVYLQKQTNYVVRFALILHILYGEIDNPKISGRTMQNAIKLCKYFIDCFCWITNDLSALDREEEAALSYIKKHYDKPVSPSKLQKSNRSLYKTLTIAKETLEALEDKGYGRLAPTSNGGSAFIFYGTAI